MCCFFCQDLQVAAAAVVREPYELNFRDRFVSFSGEFPGISLDETDSAQLTLLAWREESVSLDGFQHAGRFGGGMAWMQFFYINMSLLEYLGEIECLLSECILLWYTM